jgi:hypothetical protein
VNEVGREGGSLSTRVDFGGEGGVGDEDGLEGSGNLLLLRLAVGLNDGKTERSSPDNGSHLLFRNATEALTDRLLRPRRLSLLLSLKSGLNTSGRDGLGDKASAAVEPCLDTGRALEDVTNRVEDETTEVESAGVEVFGGNVSSVLELTLDLVLGTDEGNTVDGGHDL